MQPNGSSSAESSTDPTTTTTATTPTLFTSTVKTVYLIRHAESEENRRIAALSRTFRTLGRFSLPKASDVSASTELLHVTGQIDSDVSDIGAKQIAHMRDKLLESKFLETSTIQLVAHSPLIRARTTSEGMLGCLALATSSSSSSVSSGVMSDGGVEVKAESVSRVVETNLLLEKSPAEWTPLYYSSFKKRIGEFEEWLGKQEEEKVALVGHSQFFKAMLGLDFKFGNCEVWKVDFDPSKTTSNGPSNGPSTNESNSESISSATCQWTLPPQWSNLEQIFECDVKSSPKTI